jgi:hypothetical protein
VLLAHVVVFVRLAMVLALDMCGVLFLLGLKVLRLLLLNVLVLLLLLLDVAHEFTLLFHPFFEATLRKLRTLPHYLVVVVLNHAYLFVHDLPEVLVAPLEALSHHLGDKLTRLDLLLQLFLLKLHYLIALNLVLGLLLVEVLLALLLEVVPALLELLLLLLELPEALLPLVRLLPLQVLLALLDLFVPSNVVVLHTLLLPHVEELFGHLDGFVGLLAEILVLEPSVEVVEDLELHGCELLHANTLCLALLKVNKVNDLAICTWD